MEQPGPSHQPDSPRGIERIKFRIVDLEREMRLLNEQALQSTKNMLRDVNEASDAGVRTVSALEDQDEQLDKIANDLQQIKEDIVIMETHLRKMINCCGLKQLAKDFIGAPLKRIFCRRHRRNDSPRSSSSGPLMVSLSRRGRPSLISDVYEKSEPNMVEDEIERNMRGVSDGIRTLKEVAADIHTQLDIQRPKIERIQVMVEETDIGIGGANKKVKSLLDS